MAEQYHTDAIWQEYYNEIDPVKRVRIYARIAGVEEPDKKRPASFSMKRIEPISTEGDLIRALFLNRHVGSKGQEVDKVMAAIMEYIHLGRNQSRSSIKDIRQILQGLGCSLVRDKGEEGQALMYQEIRNGALRYLSCCRGANYGRTFFGLVAASEERQNDKTTEDIWLATRGIERLVKASLTEEELADLCLYEDAVINAFYQYDEDARDWFTAYERIH